LNRQAGLGWPQSEKVVLVLMLRLKTGAAAAWEAIVSADRMLLVRWAL
jgi:hypothetical protein